MRLKKQFFLLKFAVSLSKIEIGEAEFMSTVQSKVQSLITKLDQVEDQLGNPDLFSDPNKFKEITREHAYLTRLRDLWQECQRLELEISGLRTLIKEESDSEMLQEASSELEKLQPQLQLAYEKLKQALVPPDPYDSRNTILEIRAGTGGDEAALFVGDCVRMYQLYADSKRWDYEVISAAPSERGGYKEFIMIVQGQDVYKRLRYEAGGHRVQRVPETESQGRVHTSAITVAVIPEPDEEEEIKIDEKDLRIDTMRSSGAGGQHVNTTDSAVRITHLPSGVVVYCQQERSQLKNREKAMRLLQAKLIDMEKDKRMKEEADMRSSQIGTGDRSDRIRTYNFPQNRVTDHRLELTLYNLSQFMNGVLDGVIDPLILAANEKRLQDA